MSHAQHAHSGQHKAKSGHPRKQQKQHQPPTPGERIADDAVGWIGAGMLGLLVGVILVAVLSRMGWRWSWLLLLAPIAVPIWEVDPQVAVAVAALAVGGAAIGARWDHDARQAGGDLAARARQRRGPVWGIRLAIARGVRRRPVTDGGILIGRDERHRPVRVQTGVRAAHTLVVGTTNAGKTVTQATILRRAIEAGCGAICIDPKGDRLLAEQLAQAAARDGRPFVQWTPDGRRSYNPFAHGSASEIADKALAGETWTEPHYQRQAQRYVAHAVRAQRLAGEPVSLGRLVQLMRPAQLEAVARRLDREPAQQLHTYLDSLTAEQHRGLAGARDRLAILAESDVGPRLADGPGTIRLDDELRRAGVVLFSLEADRWPMLAGMLAAAIVSDLITLTAGRQSEPDQTPAVIAIDEFSAVSPQGIVRLFGRARSARLSLLLGTQELADLDVPEHPNLLAQVLGNTATLIAHRQRVPASAELIAEVAGTRGTWTQTRRTDGMSLPTDSGTRTRTREFHIHPDDLKRLPQGVAVVIADTQPPKRTRIDHPDGGR